MNNILDYTYLSQRIKSGHGGDGMCTILKKIKNREPYELLEMYGISPNPPVDLSALLDKIGISTIAKDFTEIEEDTGVNKGTILGAAFSNEDNLAIFYKKFDSLHRKKFTIAHELAHCCLHSPNDESSHIEFRLDPFVNLTKEAYKKERECNIFAGKLLIPKDSLMEHYEKMVVPSLVKLSEIFDVSTSVMAARLDYLELPYFKDSQTEIIL